MNITKKILLLERCLDKISPDEIIYSFKVLHKLETHMEDIEKNNNALYAQTDILEELSYKIDRLIKRMDLFDNSKR